jgi:hypothetical protein
MNVRKTGFYFCFLIIFLFLPFFLPAQNRENFEKVIQTLDSMPPGLLAVEERFLLQEFGGFGSSLHVKTKISGHEDSVGTFVL